MNPITSLRIVAPSAPDEWEKYYALRYAVLRKPWNQPVDSTQDATEATSLHRIVMDENNQVIGAGRLQFNSPQQAQVRSMAIEDSCQGRGVGRFLLNHLEQIARESGCKEVILDSRDYAIGFYEKSGYRVIAPSYLLFGIIPHVVMQKAL